MAIMKVVEPLHAAEYTGSNAAELVEVANRSGISHSVVGTPGNTLALTGTDGVMTSNFNLTVGDVLVGAYNGWGTVLPRAAFDAVFKEV